VHLLTGGLVRCGRCGESFYPRRYKSAPDSYRCRGRDGYNGPPTGCDTPPVPQPLVDAAVREIATSINLSPGDADAQVRERAAQAKRDARSAAAEVAKFERRLRHARDEWMDRALSRNEYAEIKVEYETELTNAREREAGARALERDLSVNGHDHAEAIRTAREFAGNERPSAEDRDRFRAWLQAHFARFTLHVRPLEVPGETDQERASAARKRARDATAQEVGAFTWKPRGRPEQFAVLVAEWRPEVEDRFSLETGEPPRADPGALLD
jgi:hypothetical protein